MNQLLLKIASKWSGESRFAENLKHPQNAPQMKLMNMQCPKSISADESRGPDETLRRSIQVLFFKYSTVFLSWKFIREHVFESLSQMFLDKDQTVSNLKFANRTLIVKQNKIISLGNVKYWS